ncbi:hypothetical protein AHF37_09097 [Paragonimus kellicotti]|nr:hypothetical protein AHF37_09097 [Paragonimus kellicotti]
MIEVDKPADTHSTNEKLEFMMSMEQKEWLMAVVSGDEKKMMNMLNSNPDLVNWQNYIDGLSHNLIDAHQFDAVQLRYIDLFCTYVFQSFCQYCRFSSKLLYFAISDGSLQNSALHFAAKFGNCALIRMLVGNHQADVNIRNNAVSRLTGRCCLRIGH